MVQTFDSQRCASGIADDINKSVARLGSQQAELGGVLLDVGGEMQRIELTWSL